MVMKSCSRARWICARHCEQRLAARRPSRARCGPCHASSAGSTRSRAEPLRPGEILSMRSTTPARNQVPERRCSLSGAARHLVLCEKPSERPISGLVSAESQGDMYRSYGRLERSLSVFRVSPVGSDGFQVTELESGQRKSSISKTTTAVGAIARPTSPRGRAEAFSFG